MSWSCALVNNPSTVVKTPPREPTVISKSNSGIETNAVSDYKEEEKRMKENRGREHNKEIK